MVTTIGREKKEEQNIDYLLLLEGNKKEFDDNLSSALQEGIKSWIEMAGEAPRMEPAGMVFTRAEREESIYQPDYLREAPSDTRNVTRIKNTLLRAGIDTWDALERMSFLHLTAITRGFGIKSVLDLYWELEAHRSGSYLAGRIREYFGQYLDQADISSAELQKAGARMAIIIDESARLHKLLNLPSFDMNRFDTNPNIVEPDPLSYCRTVVARNPDNLLAETELRVAQLRYREFASAEKIGAELKMPKTKVAQLLEAVREKLANKIKPFIEHQIALSSSSSS